MRSYLDGWWGGVFTLRGGVFTLSGGELRPGMTEGKERGAKVPAKIPLPGGGKQHNITLGKSTVHNIFKYIKLNFKQFLIKLTFYRKLIIKM